MFRLRFCSPAFVPAVLGLLIAVSFPASGQQSPSSDRPRIVLTALSAPPGDTVAATLATTITTSIDLVLHLTNSLRIARADFLSPTYSFDRAVQYYRSVGADGAVFGSVTPGTGGSYVVDLDVWNAAGTDNKPAVITKTITDLLSSFDIADSISLEVASTVVGRKLAEGNLVVADVGRLSKYSVYADGQLLGRNKTRFRVLTGNRVIIIAKPGPIGDVPVATFHVDIKKDQTATVSALPNGGSFGSPIMATPLMKVNLQSNERVFEILPNKDGSAFSVVTTVTTGILQRSTRYYVRQGTEKLGPFTEFERRANGAWVAQNKSQQWFVGSPSSVVGPLPSNSYPTWVHNMADRRLVYMADVSNGGFLQKGLPDASLFDNIWELVPSPTNTEVAYVGKKGSSVFVVVGNQVNGPFDNVDTIRWSPDGSICAFSVRVGNKAFVFFGNKKFGPYSAVGDLVYAPNGRTLVYSADNYIIAGTEKLGPFQSTPVNLVFAPHGDRFAFTVPQSGGNVVHLNDGTTYGPFDWGIRYSFSPDGKVFFCSGHDPQINRVVVYLGRQRTVINEQFTIANPLFSKSGKYTAFVFDTGFSSWEMDLGGKKLNIDATLPHGLLSDGMPLYWTRSNGDFYVFAGSSKQGPYRAVTNVSNSSKFRFLVYRNGEVYRLSVPR